jgi:membrane protein YqaA with SNARE-associated domain
MEVDPNLGYVALGALIGAESTGVPVPGETALLAAAVLAERGELDIELVIAVAATAAIVGDNLGYWIGRKGGRRLFELRGPLHRHRHTALARGESFFARHGPKAVFLGRWIAWLRIASAWLAGITHMHWPTLPALERARRRCVGDQRRHARLPGRPGRGRRLQGRRHRGGEPGRAGAGGVRDLPLAAGVPRP